MLLDHFHPPLKGRRHWTGFHSAWATLLAIDLNRRLPEGWFAEPTVHWGIEVDVGTFEETQAYAGVAGPREGEAAWTPPAPLKTIGFALTTDIVEVRIHHDFGDVPLVGAIEFVSPANKDRPETRDAFVSKCDHYLRDGIGLVIVDVVTDDSANLHSLLVERFGEQDLPNDSTYSSAYHPLQRNESHELDLWYQPLTVGGDLPSMPLYIREGPCVRVNLADTYQQVCNDLRINQPKPN
ncbi:MAG: hypothetical protein JNG89_07650 [Planctomycetaceae bacterium]|nr:hypothetical protein [Planctomycetaceae bacterium]